MKSVELIKKLRAKYPDTKHESEGIFDKAYNAAVAQGKNPQEAERAAYESIKQELRQNKASVGRYEREYDVANPPSLWCDWTPFC